MPTILPRMVSFVISELSHFPDLRFTVSTCLQVVIVRQQDVQPYLWFMARRFAIKNSEKKSGSIYNKIQKLYYIKISARECFSAEKNPKVLISCNFKVLEDRVLLIFSGKYYGGHLFRLKADIFFIVSLMYKYTNSLSSLLIRLLT